MSDTPVPSYKNIYKGSCDYDNRTNSQYLQRVTREFPTHQLLHPAGRGMRSFPVSLWSHWRVAKQRDQQPVRGAVLAQRSRQEESQLYQVKGLHRTQQCSQPEGKKCISCCKYIKFGEFKKTSDVFNLSVRFCFYIT